MCEFSEGLLCALSFSTFHFDTKPTLNLVFLLCFLLSVKCDYNTISVLFKKTKQLIKAKECIYTCVPGLHLSESKLNMHTKEVRSCLLMSFVCLRIPHMPVCVLACSGHYCSTPLQIIYRALRGKLGHRRQNRSRRARK